MAQKASSQSVPEQLSLEQMKRLSTTERQRLIRHITGRPVTMAKHGSYGLRVRGSVLGSMGLFKNSADAKRVGRRGQYDPADDANGRR